MHRLAVRYIGVVAVVLSASMVRAADITPVADVEAQPLAANAERVIRAMDALGASIPDSVAISVKRAKAADDARALQAAFDPLVLFVVDINPESRVKVSRGPAAAELQQAGYLPVLVKVVNESTVTKPLNISSPQAGPNHYRSPDWMKRDASPSEGPDLSGHFLQVAMQTAAPMTAELSGLKVEYAIALLYSAESGKREATLRFDLGGDEKDLGDRGEIPVLFDIRPAVRVRLGVKDFDGAPTTGRFTFRREGIKHAYPPQPKRTAPDLHFQPQIYRADGETVLLPPGPLSMEYGRGPEYRLVKKSITIPSSAEHAIDVRLERWIEPASFGFYGGDHHIHAAGCSHYTSPTQGVSPADMFRYIKGEGLNVGCCLTWGPCFDYQRHFFNARPNEQSEATTVLKYDVEVSGFGSQALGHVCLLNLRDMDYPGSGGSKNKSWPTWTTPVLRWAHSQGAVTGYAHSGDGLKVNPTEAAQRLLAALDLNEDHVVTAQEAETGKLPLPEPFALTDADGDGVLSEAELVRSHDRVKSRLPNVAIPQMNGIGAQEICVSTAMGACDFISAMDTDRTAEWNCWYHLLNCGFATKVSGETDFPCINDARVGQGRVYVQLGKIDRINFNEWCNGVRLGRSYVSDGYAHAINFRVNDTAPGFGDVALDGPGIAMVKATVAFAPELSLRTSIGGEVLPGRTRKIELVVNGKVAETREAPADADPHELKFEVKIDHSSWVALRQFPQLHTNPVKVIVAGKPIRASRDSAKWCIGTIEQLWRVREKKVAESERAEANRTFQSAIEIYRRIAAEAPAGS